MIANKHKNYDMAGSIKPQIKKPSRIKNPKSPIILELIMVVIITVPFFRIGLDTDIWITSISIFIFAYFFYVVVFVLNDKPWEDINNKVEK